MYKSTNTRYTLYSKRSFKINAFLLELIIYIKVLTTVFVCVFVYIHVHVLKSKNIDGKHT